MTEIIQLGQGHYLIKSRSNPDWHYCVEDVVCTCRASECFVRCWHLEEIERYESLQLATGTRARGASHPG
jgi:hypothetical protein